MEAPSRTTPRPRLGSPGGTVGAIVAAAGVAFGAAHAPARRDSPAITASSVTFSATSSCPNSEHVRVRAGRSRPRGWSWTDGGDDGTLAGGEAARSPTGIGRRARPAPCAAPHGRREVLHEAVDIRERRLPGQWEPTALVRADRDVVAAVPVVDHVRSRRRSPEAPCPGRPPAAPPRRCRRARARCTARRHRQRRGTRRRPCRCRGQA